MSRIDFIPAESAEWSDVVQSMHGVSTYHDRWYNQLSARQTCGRAFLLTYCENNQRVAFPLIFPDEGGTEVTSAYGYPGPLADTERLPTSLISGFQSQIRKQFEERRIAATTTRLNPFGNWQQLFDQFGKLCHVGDTVMIDLTLSNEDRRRSYRRNHRKDIAKIRKMSSLTFKDSNFDHLERFAFLYRKSMERLNADRRYMFDLDYFRFIAHHLGDDAHLLMTEITGDLLCGGIFFQKGEIAYAHLVGFVPSNECSSPIKLLFDDAAVFFRDKGCTGLFLGGGLGAQRDSLFHFKVGFSDVIVPFNIWKWKASDLN